MNVGVCPGHAQADPFSIVQTFFNPVKPGPALRERKSWMVAGTWPSSSPPYTYKRNSLGFGAPGPIRPAAILGTESAASWEDHPLGPVGKQGMLELGSARCPGTSACVRVPVCVHVPVCVCACVAGQCGWPWWCCETDWGGQRRTRCLGGVADGPLVQARRSLGPVKHCPSRERHRGSVPPLPARPHKCPPVP